MTDFMTLMDPERVVEDLGREDLLIVDCRFDLGDPTAGYKAWAAAHLPGAHYAHLDHDLASPIGAATGRHPLPNPDRFIRFARSLGIGPETRVVCYDQGGGAIAGRLWWLLRYFGHASVAVLDGGFAAWEARSCPVDTNAPEATAGSAAWEARSCPLDTNAPEATAGSFHPHRVYAGAVNVETLQRELAVGACLLLDARSVERFRGDAEPVDAVAGHVPGACNRPFTDNLDAAGCFKSVNQLHDEFQTLLGDRDPTRVIHMCGSGVTACHNLLAMEHAGLPSSRLYVGSWSEWIRDPARPIATGNA